MDATCAIQNSIHVFSLVHINMCPGFWVHIIFDGAFLLSIGVLRFFPGPNKIDPGAAGMDHKPRNRFTGEVVPIGIVERVEDIRII